jgi:hypothetical protein
MLWPPLVATVGALPLLMGRHPHAGQAPAALVAALEPLVLILLVLVVVWLRYRDPIHAWFRTAMREASEARERGRGGV